MWTAKCHCKHPQGTIRELFWVDCNGIAQWQEQDRIISSSKHAILSAHFIWWIRGVQYCSWRATIEQSSAPTLNDTWRNETRSSGLIETSRQVCWSWDVALSAGCWPLQDWLPLWWRISSGVTDEWIVKLRIPFGMDMVLNDILSVFKLCVFILGLLLLDLFLYCCFWLSAFCYIYSVLLFYLSLCKSFM